jgi:peptidoglycan hydrolase-like protein with peptidoglycan-binding domain
MFYTDLDDVYSRSAVTSSGDEFIGSFVGKNFNDGEPVDALWDNTVATSFPGCGNAGGADCDGVAGKSSALMKTLSTFEDAGYVFGSVWVMDEQNEGYPYFAFTLQPRILGVTPVGGATGVSVTSEIGIELSESASGNSSPVITSGPCGESCPTFDLSWINMGTRLILTKTGGPFAYGTTYTINIQGLVSDSGVPLDSYEWSFTTENAPIAPASSSGGRSGGRSRSSIPQVLKAETKPVTSTAVSAMSRDLKVGSSGGDVKVLQRFLNTNGFPVAPTGQGSLNNESDLFGTLTRTALTKFQIANNIVPASGYYGPVTRALVLKMMAAPSLTMAAAPVGASIPLVAPATARDLDVGMSGDDVKALQALLIAQGYPIPAGSTGLFGTQTKSALSQYQKKNNLVPASGYFGERTRAQMKRVGLLGLWW